VLVAVMVVQYSTVEVIICGTTRSICPMGSNGVESVVLIIVVGVLLVLGVDWVLLVLEISWVLLVDEGLRFGTIAENIWPMKLNNCWK